ncbi:glycosyltransferase family 2 protein [Cohnella sp. 56]|uniref:glycosyltransferase family 2 protein n=1 Tax=Cohnella sp. 56 TaxID=3113722 RepID=UPI0030E7F5F7
MNILTIFTPTYNRAYTLTNLYHSLCFQTSNCFEWLIIDDGSDDNTDEKIKEWINDNKIRIKYYKQKNRGKHIAHNRALKLCKTDLFFCVDSDDILDERAVQWVLELKEEEEGNNILGFYMRKGDLGGNAKGEGWPENKKYLYLNELYQQYNFKGEAAIILKTKLVRNYIFPPFKQEKFLRESVFYDQINKLAPMRLDNRVCYFFEYKDDGYTKQGWRLEYRNPIGAGYNLLHHIEYESRKKEKIKHMGMFFAWKKVMKVNDPLYKTIYVPVYVRFLGYFLTGHYKKLFVKHKEAFQDEVKCFIN